MKSEDVTIYDIANICACSPATVSLAMKNDPRVAKKTREKVQKVAKQSGYSPSYLGRSLVTGKTYTIKVVVPDMHNPVFINIVDGIEQYMAHTEYHILLEVTYSSQERELDSFASLLDKRVDGMIISPIFEKAVTQYVEEKGIDKTKVIYVGTPCTESEQIHYYTADSKKGAYLGVKNMLEKGCKRIAFVAPIVMSNQSLRREAGYNQALEEFEVPKDSDLVLRCGQNFMEIYKETYKLVKEQKPDGIFCLYDYAAIPIMKAVEDNGLHIPEDVMVTGYDNIEIGEFLDKPLTTIDPHQKEQGYRSAETLMKLLSGTKCPIENVVEPTLVIRSTTRN